MWHVIQHIVYIYVVVNFGNCCECEPKQGQNKDNSSAITVGKKISEIKNASIRTFVEVTTREENLIVHKLNESDSVSDDTDDKINATLTNYDAHILWCPQHDNGVTYSFDRIVDVWQTVYYRMAEPLFCFKIFIKEVTVQERNKYAKIYGNFNGSIDWANCIFEIKSSDEHYSAGRKHFLQRRNTKKGIFDNIIILEDNEDGKLSKLTVRVQSPDQWMVVSNLLLMRDCDSGNIIVFTRVPHQPKIEAVFHSLKSFGEESSVGVVPCGDNSRIERSIEALSREILRRLFRKHILS